MKYVNKNIKGFYWDGFDLDPASYDIGYSHDDFLAGKWVELDERQIAFHEANPDASVKEVIAMQLDPVYEPPQPTEEELVDRARQEKLSEIQAQDAKSNKFYVSVKQGDVEVAKKEFWIDKDTRNSLYSITLPSLQKSGETMTKLWTNGVPPQSIDVPVSWAMEKLPLLEVYAKKTYDLRASNEAAAYAATTVDGIKAINVEEGYPEYLTFELALTV